MATTVTSPSGPAPNPAPSDTPGRARPMRPGPSPTVDSHIWVSPWNQGSGHSGHDPRSGYVERFWLGIIGPSSVLLLRHLARHLDACPEGGVIDLSTTARRLGISWGPGRHNPMNRTIQRLIDFGLAREPRPAELQVRRRLPDLSRRQVERLPDELRVIHHRSTAEGPRGPARRPRLNPERLRALVHTMVDLELGPDAVEEQLRSWDVTGHQLDRACSLARSMAMHPSRRFPASAPVSRDRTPASPGHRRTASPG